MFTLCDQLGRYSFIFKRILVNLLKCNKLVYLLASLSQQSYTSLAGIYNKMLKLFGKLIEFPFCHNFHYLICIQWVTSITKLELPFRCVNFTLHNELHLKYVTYRIFRPTEDKKKKKKRNNRNSKTDKSNG